MFTREVATKALPDKSAQTVTRAAAEIIPELLQEERDYVVTTDLGNEFRGLEAALPGGAVHRRKDRTDRNATAVVDRAVVGATTWTKQRRPTMPVRTRR